MSRPDRVIELLGGYYVATGLAPFVSRPAFEAVTGRKQDWWLVETVGALVGVAGGAMVSAARHGRVSPEIAGLAAGCAGALTAIDVFYVARRRIRPTYLLDAAVEVAAIAALARGYRGGGAQIAATTLGASPPSRHLTVEARGRRSS